MLALPLLLALAVTADAPAAPAVTPAAPTMTAAPAADEEEGPGYHVAPPEAPGFEEPAPPAPPFKVEGFQAPELVVVGATVRVGGSSLGVDVGLDLTARHLGFVLGATVGGAAESGRSLRLLGVLAGYGYARGHYRGEALLGWGVASDHADEGGVTTTRNGHFRGLQAGLDRAVCGGETWRAALGLGLWWRETYGLTGPTASHSEVGGGLRLGIETGW